MVEDMRDRNALRIIDFHSHHVPSAWTLSTTAGLADGARRRWENINKRIADPQALIEFIESGDLDGRVVNIPTALFSSPGEELPSDLFRRVNDRLSEIVARRPSQLYGLASVDVFGGEAGALEVVRAVRELGFRGIFVESAKGELLLDAPQARPALAAAAALDVPVFVHPINPLTSQMSRYPRLGVLFARGTVNAASLISLLDGGVLEALPRLRVVVTNLALSGVLLAGGFDHFGDEDGALRRLLRSQVYIDTMGFHPSLIRAAVDLLGVEHVLAGSDWPIVSDGPIRRKLGDALAQAGLSDDEQRLVAGGNALRLLRPPLPH